MKHSAATAASVTLASQLASRAYAAGSDELKLGLIGCGGRGTGAVTQALMSSKTPVKLWAMADLFRDRLDESYTMLHDGAEARYDRVAFDGLAAQMDVPEERKFVGHVPDSVFVPWATGTALTRNPRFVRDLENKVGKDATVLLLCRSGKRSAAAAEAAAKAGFRNVFNVLEGFEGDLDAQQRRGAFNGWRHAGLPWIQD